jgi:hypothetical protein
MRKLELLQRELQAHVIDGDSAIAQSIHESKDIAASTRLRIYSDAYRLRLIEALASNYPVLAKAMTQYCDADAFSRLTQEYLALRPSRHFSVRWFGDELPAFLTAHPEHRNSQWMSELADFEWHIASAFDAADVELMSLADLAHVAPGDWATLKIGAHPSVSCIRFTTNVPALIKASNEDLALPEPASVGETTWMIWRQDLDVQFRSLQPPEIDALSSLIAGTDFGSLCELLAQSMDVDAVPLQAATLLKQWIADQCIARHHAD